MSETTEVGAGILGVFIYLIGMLFVGLAAFLVLWLAVMAFFPVLVAVVIGGLGFVWWKRLRGQPHRPLW